MIDGEQGAKQESSFELAFAGYHQKMPTPASRRFLTALRAGLAGRASITLGTACSGTDIAVHTLQAFLDHHESFLETGCGLRHEFSCEIDAGKRKFLGEQRSP